MNAVTDSLGVDVLLVNELPLFYEDQFVPKDSLRLTRYYSQREFASGQEGQPLPYSPRTDNGLAALLLLCFLLTSFALSRNKRFLSQLVKDFQLQRDRASIFSTSTASDLRFLLLLAVQTCVLSGICIFNYFNDAHPLLMKQVPPYILLLSYISVCLIYFVFKWIAYSFLGWTFFDKNSSAVWLESYLTIIYYAGFVLFPFVLFLIYFNLSVEVWIIIAACLVVFTKILMFYKWIRLFFSNINELFLLILYFCALEIIPCLLVYKGVMELNNYLVIKF